MSEKEKSKSTQHQPNPKPEIGHKGARRVFNSEKLIKEGYQPTDKLDTTIPPVKQENDKTK